MLVLLVAVLSLAVQSCGSDSESPNSYTYVVKGEIYNQSGNILPGTDFEAYKNDVKNEIEKVFSTHNSDWQVSFNDFDITVTAKANGDKARAQVKVIMEALKAVKAKVDAKDKSSITTKGNFIFQIQVRAYNNMPDNVEHGYFVTEQIDISFDNRGSNLDNKSYTLAGELVDRGNLDDEGVTAMTAVFDDFNAQHKKPITGVTAEEASKAMDAIVEEARVAIMEALSAFGNTFNFSYAFILKDDAGKEVYRKVLKIEGTNVIIVK